MTPAMQHLSQDPILAQIVERVGKHPERLGDASEPAFAVLSSAVIGQQLSNKAAAVIEKRVLEMIGSYSPENVARHSPEALRTCGISGAKAKTLHALAEHALSGKVDFENLKNLSNPEVIAKLLPIWGIGVWTAEMFLMFGLGREDVYSKGDGGLKRAFENLYPTQNIDEVTEKWSPYRSFASWYLWRSLDL